MPITLLWTNDDTGALDSVKFDAVTSIEHQDSVTITDHPVELGSNIADDAIDDPDRVTIEGIVTNTPHLGNLTDDDDAQTGQSSVTFDAMRQDGTKKIHLNIPDPPLEISESGLLQAGVRALGSAIFGGPNSTATVADDSRKARASASAQVLIGSGRNRAREAYEKLIAAKLARDLITVSTGMREYFDMLIERIAVPRAVADGNAVRFQVDLRRLLIAESDTVKSPEPTEARGATTKSLGSQAAKEDPNAGKKEELESTLHKGGAAAGIF
jgi:hypothetical protein